MQGYIVLVMQTMLYDGTIRVFHLQTSESEQLARSLFLHIAAMLAKHEGLEGEYKLEFWFEKQDSEERYATIKNIEKGRYTINIEQKGNVKVSYKGAISFIENGFAVTAFERANDNAF